MTSRYGSRNVGHSEPTIAQTGGSPFVRTGQFDYRDTTRGIMGALDAVKTVQDHKAKQQAMIDSMGIGGVLTPRADDKYTRTLEHMNGRADLVQFNEAMTAESSRYQDLPDDQYDAKMRAWKTNYFKGKSQSYAMGLIAAGGIDVEDKVLALRHQTQRTHLADTWISGAKKRTDGLLLENPTVDGIMAHLAQEESMGTQYYSDPKVTRAKVYESVINWAKAQEGSNTKRAYDMVKELVNAPSQRPEDKGQRLKDTELNQAIMNDLAFLKKKADAGLVSEAFTATKGMQKGGAPDLKAITAYLDKRVESGELTVQNRNLVLSTHESDYQTRIQQRKVQLAEYTDSIVRHVDKLVLSKDYKGALDYIAKHPGANPTTLHTLQQTIETEMGVNSQERIAGLVRSGNMAGALEMAQNDPNLKNTSAVDILNKLKTQQASDARWNFFDMVRKGNVSEAMEYANSNALVPPETGVSLQSEYNAQVTQDRRNAQAIKDLNDKDASERVMGRVKVGDLAGAVEMLGDYHLKNSSAVALSDAIKERMSLESQRKYFRLVKAGKSQEAADYLAADGAIEPQVAANLTDAMRDRLDVEGVEDVAGKLRKGDTKGAIELAKTNANIKNSSALGALDSITDHATKDMTNGFYKLVLENKPRAALRYLGDNKFGSYQTAVGLRSDLKSRQASDKASEHQLENLKDEEVKQWVYGRVAAGDLKGALRALGTTGLKNTTKIALKADIIDRIGKSEQKEFYRLVDSGDINGAIDYLATTTEVSPDTLIDLKDAAKQRLNNQAIQDVAGKIRAGDKEGAIELAKKHQDLANTDAVDFLTRLTKVDKTASNKDVENARNMAVLGILEEHKDNPMFDLNDAIAELKDEGIVLDFAGLKMLNTSHKILQSSVAAKYNKVIDQINARFDYKPDSGFTTPNARAALKTRMELNEYVQRQIDNNEPINWTELLGGADKQGHWLHEAIESNRPSTEDSVNEMMRSMGVSDYNPKTTPSWKTDVNKELRGSGTTVDKLTAYIKENRPDISYSKIKVMLTDKETREQLAVQYTQEHK